ncbi:hypothetical protein RF11_00037 [Thelohanellus kitauei]|uniref:Uncharacterized protein n=1 Tax=Thelohanellus kitauei TaxID=669202 RepID=A0A0C2JX60_THEKT|nr:hypothetical protein RF11_00037 [Thelohanellus kitauei]
MTNDIKIRTKQFKYIIQCRLMHVMQSQNNVTFYTLGWYSLSLLVGAQLGWGVNLPSDWRESAPLNLDYRQYNADRKISRFYWAADYSPDSLAISDETGIISARFGCPLA